MHPKVIGFHGPYGSGKDTLGLLLSHDLPESYITKFAAPMYSLAAKVDLVFHPAMTHEEKSGFLLDNPEFGTRRNFLEKLGTDFGRDMIHPNFWVTLLANQVKSIQEQFPFAPIIITDVRAENEAAWVRANDGIIFRLKPDWIQPGAIETGHRFTAPLTEDDRDVTLSLSFGKQKEAIDSIHEAILRRKF